MMWGLVTLRIVDMWTLDKPIASLSAAVLEGVRWMVNNDLTRRIHESAIFKW